MRKLKKYLRIAIEGIFGALGLTVSFARKRHNTNFAIIDRNTIEALWRNDEYMERYHRGIVASNVQDTDNFFKQGRHYLLQQMLEYALSVSNSLNVAECGCWKGHSSYLIADILAQNEFSGEFCIFDSFSGGLSDKQEEDENSRVNMTDEEIREEKQHFSSTEEDLHKTLSDFNFYKLFRGWIPERFNEVENYSFSFVHIDVDLYQPILDSLNFFYPRLCEGGVVVIDDYGFTQFPGAKKAVELFLKNQRFQLKFSSLFGGMVVIK